jgi:hypothetical protein
VTLKKQVKIFGLNLGSANLLMTIAALVRVTIQYSIHPADAVIRRLRAGRKRLIELSDCLLAKRCRGNIPGVDAPGIVGVIFFLIFFTKCFF